MTLRNLPTLNPAVTLSPSGLGPVLSGTGCKLKLLLDARDNRNQTNHLPSSGAGPWGTVIHNVLELARTSDGGRFSDPSWVWRSAGEEFDSEIADMNANCSGKLLEDHLEPIENIRRDFYEDREKLIARAERERANFLALSGTSSSSVGNPPLLGAEVRVGDDFSGSSKIYGLIDKVEINPLGGVQIVDYKTGKIVDDVGNVLDKHRTQMLLYAGLWEMRTTSEGRRMRGYPTAAFLESPLISGSEVTVSLDSSESNRLIALALTEHANIEAARVAAIASGTPSDIFQLATPSLENCRYCSARPACESYIDFLEQKMIDIDTEIFDVVGELVRVDYLDFSPKCKVIIRDSGPEPKEWAIHDILWKQLRNQEVQQMITVGNGVKVGVFGCRFELISGDVINFNANRSEHIAIIDNT